MVHRYKAFDLCVESDIRFDVLAAEPDPDRPVDIRVKQVDLGIDLQPMHAAPTVYDFENSDGILMVWHGVTAARIASDDCVEIQPYPTVPNSYLAFPILGPIFAWLMHQRGYLVMHSSAVRIDDRVIAFVGDKGAGKSTTAATFLNAGAELVTDDLLVLEVPDDPDTVPTIRPAFAQIKLMDDPDSRIEIANAETKPLIFEGFPKRQYWTGETVGGRPTCDVLLALQRGGDEPGITWMSDTEAMTQLIRFSYNVQWDMAPLAAQQIGRQFRQAARVAQTTRCGIFNVPHDLQNLDSAVARLREILKDELG